MRSGLVRARIIPDVRAFWTRLSRFIVAVVVLAGGVGAQPTVSNVRLTQLSARTVEVLYDLSGAPSAGSTVTVTFSRDGGSTDTFVPAVSELSGNVGTGVTNGSNQRIVWNSAAALPTEFYNTSMRAVVIATEPNASGNQLTITLPGGVPLVLVRIPKGTFQMGSPTTERGHEGDETQHQVTLTQDYYIGKYEITQRQWQAVMGTPMPTQCGTFGVGDGYPAYCVSWNEIAGPGGFVEKLNQQQGTTKFRLPTEAEWERAARAGTTTRFSYGNVLECDDACGSCSAHSQHAWWCGNNAPDGTKVVGQKLPNAYGLHDMHGNVWEWVQDWWSAFTSSAVTDPKGPLTGTDKAGRGAPFTAHAWELRSASRGHVPPGGRYKNVGFRLAMGVAPPTISAVSPVSGPAAGGQTVSVTGSNLYGAAVTIGGIAANVISGTATRVTFTTPAHSAGAVDVSVTTADGTATLTNSYMYAASVGLSPSSLPLELGRSGHLTATMTPARSAPTTLTITSSNPSVAAVPGSVTVEGGASTVAIPVSGATTGSTTIMATLPASIGSASASSTVTVSNLTLSLSPSTLSLSNGGSGTLTATISTPQSFPVTVSVSSTNSAVVTVPGAVTIPSGASNTTIAVNAAAPGSSTVSAQLPSALGGSSATAGVTVTQQLMLDLTPKSQATTVGKTATLTVSLSIAQAVATTVFLESSNPAVAAVPSFVTIPATRLSESFTVATGAAGTAIVSARLSGGSTSSAAVTVETPASAPARVVAGGFPPPIILDAKAGRTETTRYTLTNVGGTATTISLSKSGDQGGGFFQQTPELFSLEPGASQDVTITSARQDLPVTTLLIGKSIVSGVGVSLQIPVRVFAVSPGDFGRAHVTTSQARVDVSSPIGGPDPTGTITYTNDGTDKARALLSPDVAWLGVPDDVFEIEPGQSRTLTFRVDRRAQPDGGINAGSISGNMQLLYPVADPSAARTAAAGIDLADPVDTKCNDTRRGEVIADTLPLLGANEIALLIPGVGHVKGSGGSEFVSDVSIVSALLDFDVPDAKMYFASPKGVVSTTQPIQGMKPLQVRDLAATYFNQGTDVIGTTHVRSRDATKLKVSANIFNRANPKGLYGTAIPVFRSDRAVGANESTYLCGLRKDETTHTNIYVQEASGFEGNARIEFFDASGSMIGAGTRVVPMGAFGLTQLSDVVPPGGVMAVVSNISTSGARLVAFATPVDRKSGDTWAIADWNRQYGLSGGEPMVIPVAGFAPGANDSLFRSDVAVTNVGAARGTVSLTYYPGSANAITKSLELNPRETRTITDVAQSFFGLIGTSVGSIVATPLGGARFAISSRTYTASPGDPATYGTAVPTPPISAALTAGQSQIFGGLDDSVTASAGIRTNLGLVEVGGRPVLAKVSVFFADGRQLAGGAANGSRVFSLAPRAFRQLNGVVREIIGESRDKQGDLSNVRVKVDVLNESTGSLIVYVSSTDNGTNDTLLRTE